MVITATVLMVDGLRAGDADYLVLRLYLLFGGTLAGILLAAFTSWHLLGPMASTYRRAGLAMVCAFATVVVMLVCIPINELAGPTGLGVLLAGCGMAAVLLAALALRLRQRV
jgi:FtsH-binding integral membrane protein